MSEVDSMLKELTETAVSAFYAKVEQNVKIAMTRYPDEELIIIQWMTPFEAGPDLQVGVGMEMHAKVLPKHLYNALVKYDMLKEITE